MLFARLDCLLNKVYSFDSPTFGVDVVTSCGIVQEIKKGKNHRGDLES